MRIKMIRDKGKLKKGCIYEFDTHKANSLLTSGHCVRLRDLPIEEEPKKEDLSNKTEETPANLENEDAAKVATKNKKTKSKVDDTSEQGAE